MLSSFKTSNFEVLYFLSALFTLEKKQIKWMKYWRMGDSITPLKLKKLQNKWPVLMMENVLFANLHPKIYIIQ